MYTLSTLEGQFWACFRSTRSSSKLPIGASNFKKEPKVAYVPSFYPVGRIKLIFVLRADFQNYRIWA